MKTILMRLTWPLIRAWMMALDIRRVSIEDRED